MPAVRRPIPECAVARYPAEIDLDLDFGFGRGLCFGRTGRCRPVAASGPVRLLGTPDGGRTGPDVGIRCFGCCVFSTSILEEGASFRRRCSTLCFMPRSVSPGRSSGRSAGFGGRCSALCFRPRSVSSGRGFGRSADSGVWCSCTAFHAAPVIEEQVRMACVPHSSCLFQIGPAERQHRAAPPAGCRSYLHCTAVYSAQRRQPPCYRKRA